MNSFRITQQSIGRQTFENLQQSLGKLQALQEEISSGKQLNRPSDSPQGTVAALRFRGDITRGEQYSRNIDDGLSWLGMADSTLQSAVAETRSVRDIVIQGQSGALGANERNALAAQVDKIRDGLVSLANTRYLDRPIFGGTAGAPDAYSSAGTFLGNTGGVARSIAPGLTLDVNVNGPAVFGSDTTGLFATLTQISNDLRSNPAGLQGDLAALDGHMSTMQSQLAEVGSRYRRLEVTKDRNTESVTGMKQGLSEVEDADLPKTIVDLRMQEIAYQAALAATSKVITPSLVDFLR